MISPSFESLVTAMVLVMAGATGAAHAETLTVDAAVRRALASHPAVAASAAAGEEARAGIGEARAAWFPSLRLTAAATRYEEPMAVFPIHGFKLGALPPFDRTIYQGGLNLGYTLFDGFARGARIHQARERAVSAEAAFDAAGQAVAGRVIAVYIDILSRREILEAQDRRLSVLEAERARVGQFLDAGRAAPVERFRIDAAIANAQAERVGYASALAFAEDDLARLIGGDVAQARGPDLRAVELADTLPPDRERIVADAIANSPVLVQARAQSAAAEAGSRAARGIRFPSIALAGNYNGWADSKGGDQFEWNAGAQISMPLFAGGAIDGGIARSDAARRGAAEQLRLTDLQLRQEIDRAFNAITEAHARVRSLTSAVASTGEIARIEKLALAAGSGTQTDYLSAEADLFNARANLVTAHYREIVTRVDLARITGQLSLDWLAQNLEPKP